MLVVWPQPVRRAARAASIKMEEMIFFMVGFPFCNEHDM
jgi:hypothetical protein